MYRRPYPGSEGSLEVTLNEYTNKRSRGSVGGEDEGLVEEKDPDIVPKRNSKVRETGGKGRVRKVRGNRGY